MLFVMRGCSTVRCDHQFEQTQIVRLMMWTLPLLQYVQGRSFHRTDAPGRIKGSAQVLSQKMVSVAVSCSSANITTDNFVGNSKFNIAQTVIDVFVALLTIATVYFSARMLHIMKKQLKAKET